MKKNVKSCIAGSFLYSLAVFFAICLLTVILDFAGFNPAENLFLYKFGKMLASVYGFCSALIPIYLLAAAFECFSSKWRTKKGVILLGSIIPFFTLDALEHLCRIFISENSGDILAMKLTAAILTGLLLVVIEYLVLSIIGNSIENFGKKNTSSNAENEFAEDDLSFLNLNSTDADSDSQQNFEENIPTNDNNYESNVDFTDNLTDTSVNESNSPSPFDHIFDETAVESENAADSTSVSLNSADNSTSETIKEETSFEPNEIFSEQENPDTSFEEASNIQNDFSDYEKEETEEFEEFEDSLNMDEDNSSDLESDNNPQIDEPDFSEESEEPDSEFDEEFDENPFNGYDYDSNLRQMNEEELDSTREYFSEEKNNSTEEDFNSSDLSEQDSYEQDTEDNLDLDIIDAFEGDARDFTENTSDLSKEDFFDDEISFDEQDSGDFSKFLKERNISFQKIYNQAEQTDSETSDKNLSNFNIDAEKNQQSYQPVENTTSIKQDFEEVDPSLPPVIDKNGMPFGPAVPFDVSEQAFEEVNQAKKAGNPISFAQKAVFLEESKENQEEIQTEIADHTDNAETPVMEQPKPKLKLSDYNIPIEGILQVYNNDEYWIIDEDTKMKAQNLVQTLKEFNIDVEVTGIRKGPVVTMFEVLPARGVNVNRIRSLQDNIALRLAATSLRIVSPIPGKSAVGIEIPNKTRAIVSFREIIEQKFSAFDKMSIPVILGKDISGEPQIIDLAKTPHLLIAGSTGAGKSVCVNSLILSILYKRNPQQVKLILIDPKVVELKLYNDIPHLLTPVITEPKKALQSLQYCLCEMERRYALLDNMGVRDITSYNKRITERKLMQEKLPYIVIIIDEFADLMATTGKELETNVSRLAAMSRAVGIHLVLATQRPSVNVITGLIKANIPSRIAFMVASRTDSNIIIDQIGAEKLLGKGDMLYASATDPFPVRIQGTLVSDDEVEKVVDYVKQYGEPDYIDDEIFVDDEDDEEGDGNLGLFSDGEDPLYDRALELVVQSGKASASYLQRRLKIGYNRAARLIEDMEERGIVGPQNGSKPRDVIYVP